MSTNFDIPPCPNSLEGQVRCARSDTCVERETDEVFVIRCRTCGTINIWPKTRDENKARYEARLRQHHMASAEASAQERKRAYSFGGE